jgi:AsmA protein
MKQHPLMSIPVAAVVLLLLAVFLVPLLVNANALRPTLESQLSTALGRKVTLGNLSFSVFSGSLVAGNISIADDPAFSTKPFFQAQSLHIGVEVAPLLFQRKLLVTSFVADSPSINLVHNALGGWNFSSLGSTAASRTQNTLKETALPNFTVGRMKVENATAVVSDVPSTGPPFTYSKLNLSVQQFSFARAFPFLLSGNFPGGGRLDVKGNAGPVNEKDAAATPLGANITVKHFDPVAAGVVPKSQGISMLADIAAQVTSNGQILTSNGTVHAAQLQLVVNGSPAASPVDVTYTLNHNLDTRTGQIDDLAIRTGGVIVHANGTYATRGPQTTVALRLAAPNLPIDQAEVLLPAFGVRLPSGSRLQGGTLTADLSINGPAISAVISGPIEVDNTRLTGFDLSSKIGGPKPVSGSQAGTQIQTLRADVNSSSQITRIENLYASVPLLGAATGAGTVASGGELNFQVLAKLNTAAADGIPIHITGYATNPVIQANPNRLLQNNAGKLFHH